MLDESVSNKNGDNVALGGHLSVKPAHVAALSIWTNVTPGNIPYQTANRENQHVLQKKLQL